MKIRTKKDVEELKDTIKTELGIDVSQYKDAEVAGDIVDLILFPKYIVKRIIGPLLIALVLFVIGFFLLDLVHVEYIIYLVVGFILYLLVGLFAGLLLLTKRLKDDVEGIAIYSLNIMESSLNDIDEINERITPENRKDVFGLLFQGIIHIVTIPMLSEALEKKVAFIGSMAKGFIKRSLAVISDRIDFDEDKIDENILNTDDENIEPTNYLNAIIKSKARTKKTIGKISKVVTIPFRLVFWICCILLLLFLYIIH